MALLVAVLAFLERPKSAKWLILASIFIVGWFDCVREYYDMVYGIGSGREAHSNTRRQIKMMDTTRRRATSSPPPFEYEPKRWHCCRKLRRTSFSQLDWLEFPQVPLWWRLIRVSTLIWMAYVIIKCTLSDHIERWLNSMVKLQFPIHCYLMGRFVLEESLYEVTAALVSSLALAWMWFQLTSKPIRMDVINFLLMSEHDLELVYSRFYSRASLTTPEFQMSLQMESQLLGRELFLLNTLCYRVCCTQGTIFRLRANRTRESHLKLRRLIALMTLISSVILAALSVVFLIVFTILHQLDQRYMRLYPKCDPELERLNALGLISPWSMTLRGHHLLAVLADHAENLLIWTFIGLMALIAPTLIFLVGHDLVLCWHDIDSRIRQLDAEARGINREKVVNSRLGVMPVMDSLQRCAQVQCTRKRELVFSMSDFIHQVAKVDTFLSRMLDCATIGVLGLCAIYTYYLRTNSMQRLPWQLVLMVGSAGLIILIGSYGFLMVHRTCNRSYTRLCSLMALDSTKSETKLIATIEYFIRRRECFLIMGQYPFLPTTFLTLVGWTFSCFCIMSEVISRNGFG